MCICVCFNQNDVAVFKNEARKKKSTFVHVKNEGDLLLQTLRILCAVKIGLEIEHLNSFWVRNTSYVSSWTWPETVLQKQQFAHAY